MDKERKAFEKWLLEGPVINPIMPRMLNWHNPTPPPLIRFTHIICSEEDDVLDLIYV